MQKYIINQGAICAQSRQTKINQGNKQKTGTKILERGAVNNEVQAVPLHKHFQTNDKQHNYILDK
jgi:hypothetical protein